MTVSRRRWLYDYEPRKLAANVAPVFVAGALGQAARTKEPKVTLIEHPPANGKPPAVRCDVCNQTFVSDQGVLVHKARKHNGKAARPTVSYLETGNRKPPTPKPTADPWIIVVPGVESIVLSTADDAKKVAALIGALNHEVFMFRLADGKP